MIYLFNYKKVLTITLFAIVLILWGLSLFNANKLARKNKELLDNITFLNQTYTTSKNKFNEEIAKQDALLTKSHKYANSLINEITWNNKIKSKNINVVVKEKIVTEIDTQLVYLQDTSSTDTNFIRVPNTFFTSNPYFTIKGKVLKDRLFFEKISFTNTVTTVVVKERHNLFYNKQVVYVHMSNPHSSIKDMKSVVIKKEPNKILKYGSKAIIFFGGIYIGTRL